MIDKNKKYKTRDGREVRIYATDGYSNKSYDNKPIHKPIHGAYLNSGGWCPCSWSDSGRVWTDCLSDDHPADLVEDIPLVEGWCAIDSQNRIRSGLGLTRALAECVGKDYRAVHLREVRE